MHYTITCGDSNFFCGQSLLFSETSYNTLYYELFFVCSCFLFVCFALHLLSVWTIVFLTFCVCVYRTTYDDYKAERTGGKSLQGPPTNHEITEPELSAEGANDLKSEPPDQQTARVVMDVQDGIVRLR